VPGLRDRLTVGAYRGASFAAQTMPKAFSRPLASGAGAALSLFMEGRRSMVERHLRRVDPSLTGARLRAAVQEAFDSYARYYVESFRLPALSASQVDAEFSYRGYQHIDDALSAGTGAVLALPHLGGWEWAGRWIADRGIGITAVVEPLEPPEVFEWFTDYRRSLGLEIVPLGPDAATACVRALRNNHILCLPCDRDLPRDGVSVEFFGERTTMPPGPATLALRMGAPLIPIAVYFKGRHGHFADVRPPIDPTRTGKFRDDVARMTQDLAHVFEDLIREAPTQWHLFQPNWPSDPGYGPSPGS
jgi:phosphatidylinositol dimannoside acyltransferase